MADDCWSYASPAETDGGGQRPRGSDQAGQASPVPAPDRRLPGSLSGRRHSGLASPGRASAPPPDVFIASIMTWLSQPTTLALMDWWSDESGSTVRAQRLIAFHLEREAPEVTLRPDAEPARIICKRAHQTELRPYGRRRRRRAMPTSPRASSPSVPGSGTGAGAVSAGA